MKTKITMGELSKLYNISTQTLRFYDKVDLFKPIYVDENNGYRYYGIEQFALLDVIIFLREMNLTIDEIKWYIKRRNLDSFIGILERKREALEDEIRRLQLRKNSIDEKIRLINNYKYIDEQGEVILKEYGYRKEIQIPVKKLFTL